MNTVRFIIRRKAAFVGALLPYHIYINGDYVGTLRNGKTLSVEVPKADIYYIEDGCFTESNAVMYDRGLPENRVLLQRHGGWRTASYDVFYVNGDRQWEPLPTFHFEKCHSAIFQNAISRLSAEEQILALCLEFEYGITDDLEEVLASENLFDIIEALQTVGAKQYADFLRHILRHDFRDVRFPLDDEQIASRPLQRRIEKTHKAIWNDKVAHDEFHKAVVLYLLTKFSNADTIF